MRVPGASSTAWSGIRCCCICGCGPTCRPRMPRPCACTCGHPTEACVPCVGAILVIALGEGRANTRFAPTRKLRTHPNENRYKLGLRDEGCPCRVDRE